MCKVCSKGNFSLSNFASNLFKTKNKQCKYTLSSLKEKLIEFPDNPYLKSAINSYDSNCNAYNKKIDELFI